jgi:hypothetical protein
MSDPRRLLDAGNDMEVALLESAHDDRPSPHARRRTIVALGLGGSIVGASATISSATAAASTTGLGVFKWIVFGVVSGLVTAGGSHLVMQGHEAPAKPAMAVKGPTLIAPRVRREIEAAISPASAPTKEVAPVEMAAPPARLGPAPPRPPASPSSKASATTLAQEVASLDSAREALSTGDSGKAIEALDRHEKQFKSGALSPEVEVLRMEALLQRGDRAGAAGAANAFLAAHPTSPHANRVRSILAQATSGPSSAAPPAAR